MANINSTLPVLLIGHGNPMNAIVDSKYSSAWRDIAVSIPQPKAILCISAHWETDGTFVTAMPKPRTIHDFYGFPDELFQVQYLAPGSADLAERIRGMVHSTSVQLDDSWGLDHGAWSVLRRMYPKADIPVIQISLDRTKSADFHYKLGAELAGLRDEGVLIIGSGNIVHNLSLIQWNAPEAYPWAEEFDQLVAECIVIGDHNRLINYQTLGRAGEIGRAHV